MTNAAEHKVYGFDDFRIDVAHLMLYHEGAEIPMVPKAVETLLALIERRGKIVSKDELLEAVWPDAVVEESNLFLYLSLLRKTLGTHKDGSPYLETLRRRGYRFNGEVHLVQEAVEDKNYGLPVDEFEQSRANIQSQPARLHVVNNWNRHTGSEQISSASSALPALIPFEPSLDLTPSKNELAPDKLSADLEVSEGTLKQATRLVSDTGDSRRSKLRYVLAVSLVILLAGVVAGSLYWRSRRFAVTHVEKPKTIAILPFRPLVAQNRDEVLELGMADILITKLGGLGEVVVRPFSSVRKYTALDQDAVQAGRELGVDAVLDSSVQRVGERIQVTARFVRVSDGKQLWSTQFDEKFTDIFTVQDDICERVAGELALNLDEDKTARLTKHYTSNPDAYQLYLKGRYYWYKGTPQDSLKARDSFQQAIDLDPAFALAYSGLADYYGRASATDEMRPDEGWPRCEAAVRKALELDPDFAEIHNSLAGLKLYYYRDLQGAETEFQRALELDPNYVEAVSHYGAYLTYLGRFDEAIAQRKLAEKLDPLSSGIARRVGVSLYHARRYDEAIQQLLRSLEFDYGNAQTHEHLRDAYEQKKIYDKAVTSWHSALTLSGNEELAAILDSVYKESGYERAVKTVSRKRLEQLTEKQRRNEYVPAMDFVRLYIRLGDKERSLAWLEKAYQERSRSIFDIKVEPLFDDLRSEPRFVDLLRRLNLEK